MDDPISDKLPLPAETEPDSASGSRFFFSPLGRRALLFALFAVAMAIRLYHAGDPPFEFHPTRQYRSALIARAMYFEIEPGIPESERAPARLNREREGVLEPPIVEWLAARAYRIAGGESPALPRAMSSIFWLIGGVFVYRIAARLISCEGALLSVGFHLLLPFAVLGGRSFQPDALAIALALGAIDAATGRVERLGATRFAVMTALAAAAILVKPPALFPIYGAWMGAAIVGRGAGRSDIRRGWVPFASAAALSLTPAAAYYLHAAFGGGALGSQAQGSFMPSLLAHGFFWKGWLHIIREVVGYPALIAALLGVVAAPAGAARGLLVGLWGGYFALGLVFSLHVHTHDYYSLPLAPIVGLSLAPLGGAALALIARRADRVPWRWAAAAAIALAVALTLREARWRLAPPGIAREVEIARRIGELTGHTERALILDPFFGKAIQYHGALSGIPWPRPTDAGPLGASPWGEAEVRAWMEALRESFDPTHFILTDFNALEDQPGLRTHLDAAYPSVASEGGFAIWDLREKDASGAMKN